MLTCEKCGKVYTNIHREWCKPCQINNLKGNFTNWTSGNEKIDNFIQEMQIMEYSHRIFEWIPYNQFNDIKEIGKGTSPTKIYSAIWKNGTLRYAWFSSYKKRWIRKPNKEVVLKYSSNSIDKFLSEV